MTEHELVKFDEVFDGGCVIPKGAIINLNAIKDFTTRLREQASVRWIHKEGELPTIESFSSINQPLTDELFHTITKASEKEIARIFGVELDDLQ
jgi:hypothetical protein